MRVVVETFTKALKSPLVFLKPSTRVSIGFLAYLIRSPVGFEVRESINRPLVDSLERPPGEKAHIGPGWYVPLNRAWFSGADKSHGSFRVLSLK